MYIRNFGAFSYAVETDGTRFTKRPCFFLHPKFAAEHNLRAGKGVSIPSTSPDEGGGGWMGGWLGAGGPGHGGADLV